MFSKLKSCSRLNLHRNLLKMDQANLSNIKTIVSSNAPKAIGPYSQGKIVNSVSNLVYTSGSIGINPETGKLISEDINEQMNQSMKNLNEILKAANSDFDNVIKTTIYLIDMADYPIINKEYEKYFNQSFPARTCIAVKGLPLNAKVEIEMIAVQKN